MLPYEGPFDLREGGTVTASYADNPAVKSTATFARIERIPMTVVYASSQETGIGDAANLVDGDPSTTWHTMYSVTVANYPTGSISTPGRRSSSADSSTCRGRTAARTATSANTPCR